MELADLLNLPIKKCPKEQKSLLIESVISSPNVLTIMGKNVLLIVLDSLRAENASVCGYGNKTTPFLEEFCDYATIYTQARSPSTWSLPSHTSMFTGYDVAEHRISSRSDQLNPGHSIWEQLRDEFNYSTAVFSDNPFITRSKYGLQRGFENIVTGISTNKYPFNNGGNPEKYRQESTNTSDSKAGYLKYCTRNDRPILTLINGMVTYINGNITDNLPAQLSIKEKNSGELYADRFLRWENNTDDPWAACINLVDTHHPYLPKEQFDNWGGDEIKKIHSMLDDHRWDFHTGAKPWWQRQALESLYDGCILEADNVVKKIIRKLRSQDSLEDTLVIITSDHGEGFGEFSRVRPGHRLTGNESGIHECQLHVPLLVKKPEQQNQNVVDELATLSRFRDVVLSEISEEESTTGFASGGPIIASADYDAKYEIHTRTFDDYIDQMDNSAFSGWAHAVYNDSGDKIIKYSEWGEFESTVQISDPQNSMKVSSRADGKIEEYIGPLNEVMIKSKVTGEASSQTREKLQDLGYL